VRALMQLDIKIYR